MFSMWDILGFAVLFFGVGWGIKLLNSRFSFVKTKEELAYEHLQFMLGQAKEDIQVLKIENDRLREEVTRLSREIGRYEGNQQKNRNG